MVRLISAEGHEFVVHRDVATVSGTIASMLQGPGTFAEAQLGEINFREISSAVLQHVIEYCYYKRKYTGESEPPPEFVVPPAMALEILMAANFLDV